MYDEADLLPISALQHLLFCERQCALIHVEQLWAENRLTVEGRQLHRNAHERASHRRGDQRHARAVALSSTRLGLIGVADVVEFHEPDTGEPPTPFPVEYKRGRPKRNDADRVQLCAQALCLEEMLGVPVPSGAIFYGRTRRRLDISFDPPLRERTNSAIQRLRQMVRDRETPRARRMPKCDRCSLVNLCLPDAMRPRKTAGRYLEDAIADRDRTSPAA